jgi:DNA invertase Pin-like site-specific DNA recombinase
MSLLKAVIYVRVSTEEQAENGTSLETQREMCEQEARRLNAL